MSVSETSTTPVASTSRGKAGPPIVLLHGQGAAGVVWEATVEELSRRDPGRRVITVDLPGHGRSSRLPRYTPGSYAAAVATVLPADEPVVLVGHSLGGLVALALATGLFGVSVSEVVSLSMKVRWTPEEERRRSLAAQAPPKNYPDRESARAAFGRRAGLGNLADPAVLDVGIAAADGGYALAHDPATGALPPYPAEAIAALARQVDCPLRLGCGTDDPMVALVDLRELGPAVATIDGAGHNVHVERPSAVADLILAATKG